jgi:hypothetical protein
MRSGTTCCRFREEAEDTGCRRALSLSRLHFTTEGISPREVPMSFSMASGYPDKRPIARRSFQRPMIFRAAALT